MTRPSLSDFFLILQDLFYDIQPVESADSLRINRRKKLDYHRNPIANSAAKRAIQKIGNLGCRKALYDTLGQNHI